MTGKSTLTGVLVLFALALVAIPAASQTPHPLTLKEAIEKGLQSNLRVLVAGTQVAEAEGTRDRRLARLLPRARAESLASVQTRNLRAFGIDIPGRPPIVGPFSNFDYRVYVDQPLLDLPSYNRWRASQEQEKAARNDYQDVRDLIIRQVAALYLDAQAAQARVEAADSRVATAEELHRLAVARRDSGVATGVDVLRAQVELANERQNLLEARNQAKQSLLDLARAIGADMSAPLELADRLELKLIAPPDVNSAVAGALSRRADYLSLQSQEQVLNRETRANHARWFPRLNFGGNYGAIGIAPGSVLGTGALQGTVTFDIFDWDRRGEREEIDSRRQRLNYRMADLRQGIEQEIRQALLDLESATEQVAVAQQGRELAAQELDLARERFQAGVATNIEVTTAQESLARAQENHILALTRHADARVALARALGATEEIYQHYLGIE